MRGGGRIKDNYVLYHCHSDYSLLDSCSKFQEYVDLAVRNGQKAIAFSEHGKPLGWVSKKLYCDEAKIKFIHAVEIYLTERLFTENGERVRDNYHTVLLARNWEGVKELNALVRKSCDKDHFYYTNRITFDEFLGISDNIISTSACLASPLNKLPDSHPRYMELARKYDFLEVQPHDHPDQITFNKKLLALSKETGIPLIAGTDTHSSTPYKAEYRKILLGAKRKSYGDEDAFDLTYKTYDELVEMFARQGALDEGVYLEAIANTNKMADMVEDFQLDTSIKYPILYGSKEADEEKFAERVERKTSFTKSTWTKWPRFRLRRSTRNCSITSRECLASRSPNPSIRQAWLSVRSHWLTTSVSLIRMARTVCCWIWTRRTRWGLQSTTFLY